MRALITGGSGYFGSLLVNKLLKNGFQCRIIDLNEYIGSPEVEFIKGDIRDIQLLHKACKNIDVIFHNVAQVPLAKDKNLFFSVNVEGTDNILKSALSSKVKKLIYTSSSAIYGVPEKNPVNEKMTPVPQEDYGKAKYKAEKLCEDYINRGLDVIMIRPRTILGHGRLGIFQILFEWIRSGNNIPVLGKGNNLYQFIHADDLANAIISASKSNIKSGLYNCGTDRFGTMREALENLCEYAKTGSKVKSVPFNLAIKGMEISSALGISPLGSYHSLMYGRSMYFDISKAKDELAWKPKFSNDEMFKESYDWYCKNRHNLSDSNSSGSHHQSKVKEGILSIVKLFL